MSRASGVRAGRAFVEIGADRSQAERELRAFQNSLNRTGQRIAGIGAKIATGVAAVVGAGFGGWLVPMVLLVGAGVANGLLSVIGRLSSKEES